MTKTEDAGPTTDPFEVWRQLYDTNERTWSAALEQAMGSPEFGESSWKLLETMLAAQKSVRDNMRTYLETIKTIDVPTRKDIARLGELVIGLEKKIDRRYAIEDAIRAKAAASAKAATARAAATAKAASARAKAATVKAKAASAKAATAKAATARAAIARSTSAKAATATGTSATGTK